MSSSSKSSRQPSRVRKWLRRAGIAFGGLVLLLVAVFVGAWLYFSDERVRVMAEDAMENALGRPARIARLDFHPFSSLRLGDLVVEEASEYGPGDLLAVESLEVRYQWLSLLRSRFDIDEVRVVKPEIRLVRSRAGKVNVAHLPVVRPAAPPTGKKPRQPAGVERPEIPMNIEKFVIENGTLSLHDDQRDISMTFEGIDAAWGVVAAAPSSGGASGTISIRSATWQGPGDRSGPIPEVSLGLALEFDTRRGTASLELGRIASPVFQGSASAGVQGMGAATAELDLSFQFAGDLAAPLFDAFLGEEIDRGGRWNVTGNADGSFDRLTGHLEIQGERVRMTEKTGAEDWLNCERLVLAEEVVLENGRTLAGNGLLTLTKLKLSGFEEISTLEFRHQVGAERSLSRAVIRDASVVFPGGEATVKGEAVNLRGRRPKIDLRVSGHGKLDKLLDGLFSKPVERTWGDIEFEAVATGPVYSPTVSVTARSPMVQHVPKPDSERRVFFQDVDATAEAAVREGGNLSWTARATYAPLVVETGKQPVRFGQVLLTGRGNYVFSDRSLDVEEIELSAPGMALSGTAEISLPFGESESDESKDRMSRPEDLLGILVPVPH